MLEAEGQLGNLRPHQGGVVESISGNCGRGRQEAKSVLQGKTWYSARHEKEERVKID